MPGDNIHVRSACTLTITAAWFVMAIVPGVSRAAVAYVQGNYSAPQSSQITVAVPFTKTQNGTDLNVIVVGWNDTTASVVSVTDTLGNTYVRAVGPAVISGVESQSIYYAKSIAPAPAGSNIVTVTFTVAANFPDIRIAEYAGLDPVMPLDVVAQSSGKSTTSNSGTATTTNANDLLVGANLVQTTTKTAGTGYTSRILSQPDGDILEDRTVTAVGSYGATASVSPSGQWIMQLIALRAATGGGANPPTAPGSLTAASISATQINLAWTASTSTLGVANYLIERCQGQACTTFAQIASITGTLTGYSDTGLSGGSTYSYRVRAADTANNLGPYSNIASAVTQTPPSAPSPLTASASGTTQITLNWGPSSSTLGLANYIVQRCQGLTCVNFGQLVSLAATVTTYTDTNLTSSTAYSYRVQASDTNGNLSAFSNVATATTQGPPTAPANLTATVASASQINLVWSASTSSIGLANYVVEQCQGAGCGAFAQIASLAGTVTTFSNTGLTAGTSYTYRVRAVDTANNFSPYSNLVTAVTQTPPTAPGTLGASATGATQITLTWGPSSSNVGLAGYLIEQCQGAACGGFVQIASVAGTVTTYNNTGLTANTAYNYRVRATDTAHNLGPYSNIAGTTTQTAQPPTAPANLTATASGTTQINLAWSASTSNVGLANYIVQRCTGTTCTNFAQVGTPTATTYGDSGLAAGTTYQYRVQAIDTAGTVGPFSNVAAATTQSTPASITFVQVNSTTPQTALTSVQVPFAKAQNPGDLNVVAVGWNDSTAAIVTVTDTNGNTYTRAAGPTVITGTATQSIYFAPNIAGAAAGANIVSITFSPAAAYADVRIAEYGGIDPVSPLDVVAAGTGNSTSSTSGAVTTLNANDLLVAANLVQTNTTGAGTGYTSRIITPIDADILEDRVVTATGSYTGTATISPASPWIMQLVAFRAAAGGLQLPTAPSNLTAVPVTPTQVNLSWSASTSPVGIASYALQRCQGTGCTTFAAAASIPAPATTYSDTGLPSNNTYTYRIQAVDGSGNVSPFSNLAIAALSSTLTISPRVTTLTFTRVQQFTASMNSGVVWQVDGLTGGSPTVGTISTTGLYTPPATVGTHLVTVALADLSQSASSTVYITNYPGTFTRDIDTLRTGLNPNETVLTPANVNVNQFGKLISYSLDGTADASVLYVPNLSLPGQGYHNVAFVATEHDSVYAFDADARQNTPLWHVSFINPAGGITTVPPNDTGECCDISPEIGITGTPVIDPTTNTLYVVVKTKEVSGGTTNYYHRLHALDLLTGAEKFGGPVVIQASTPGTGSGSSGGVVPFISLHENQRAALLLSNGVVYIAFGGHGDVSPYHGWILGYNASTLQQVMKFCTSPNDNGVRSTGGGQGSGVWMSGDGLATDATGNIYFVTGNGIFDANTNGPDYGDSFLKISPSGTLLDYFTPFDQQYMNDQDIDLGSGGVLLLPDQSGPHTHMAITAGKNGTIYVLDRDNLGHYNASNNNQIVQTLVNTFPNGSKNTGNFKAPVFWNGSLYFSADADYVKCFTLTNGLISSVPVSQSSFILNYPGATLGFSANGTSNGILWAVQRVGLDPTGGGTTGPGSLHAFDGLNLTSELYNSNQASGSRDVLDFTAKWSAPLVANGKVYVASVSELSIFGLLP